MEQDFLLTRIQYFTTGLILGISLLHLFLYIFWRKRSANLYYSLFLLFLATTIFSDFQQLLSTDSFSQLFLKIQRGALSVSLIAGQLFFYKLFKNRIPRYIWLFSLLLALTGAAAVIQPLNNFIYLQVIIIAVLIDLLRITYLALRTESDQLWIVGAGFLIFALFSGYDLLLDLDFIQVLLGLENGYQFGIIGLIITTSIYLAMDFSDTNQKVIDQEKDILQQSLKQEMLREEVARTSKELEEARKLQLSMLPNQLPEPDHYLMAANMRTAVEVGGDYYDYNIKDDGQLTLTIGDATGHGNRAGFMVAIIKSLFKSYQPDSDFPAFFNKVTRILKQMNLGSLYMALSCVNVKENVLTLSAAGMPPALLFRDSTKSVEEIVIKGMPLGAFNDFPYKQKQLELQPNDTLLLLSDGLDELFNEDHEMFGWERVKSTFQKYATLKPEDLITKLNEEADHWRGNKPIDDDITFAVLKYR
ncbi:PP2C family protein-serine/threonine phosphatase [Rhodohalobacter mucosus]|uniref:PPM-type phosphatase domain-containing protein n=1 Tax=Rhodohalobacter mucosus TaxID=2079485 RepID=A0A316TN26_9BACT|nr:PP2C family protein-serine/threonine phosphatase [Rhodohalobacter mucosus]PWN06007.1 hypothetical protein DDZ15_12570 [Rhodohalobacter mucosus]